MTFLMGAVAYDPKVVTIWAGMRAWLKAHEFPFDFVLYSHYERQAEDLAAGRIDAAWNSPLAWIRTVRLAHALGHEAEALFMRDTDRDLTSVFLVRNDSAYEKISDLENRAVAMGAVDSPQARLIPSAFLREAGLTPGQNVQIRRFDVGVGLHGDHIGGERDAIRALLTGEVEAAAVIDSNHLLFSREGTIPSGRVRVLAQTPAYDHCNMSVINTAPRDLVEEFKKVMLSMSYADPEVRPLLDLEGLTRWQEGRTTGYSLLETAVDQESFYDEQGQVKGEDYSP